MCTTIRSRRLSLVSMGIPVLEALTAGDRAGAGRLLSCAIPPDLDVDRMPVPRRLRQLRADPTELPWLVRAVVERASGTMIGHAGFHAPPGSADLDPAVADGVELGYSITPSRHRQGFAVEAAVALMRWAHEAHARQCFVLSVSPTNLPSTAMAAKLGFTPVGSHMDVQDGLEIVLARRLDRWPDDWSADATW